MDEPGVFLQTDELVLYLVSNHYLLDHESICSFAATSKAHNQRMLSLAAQKKENLFGRVEGHVGEMRHKYGSAYCCAYKRPGENNGLGLIFNWLDENGKNKSKVHCFSGFMSPLPFRPVPFFNKEGVLCFYGYGTVSVPYEDSNGGTHFEKICNIVRYGLDKKTLCCTMKDTKPGVQGAIEHVCLDLFLEYPVLLKAVLNSTIITTQQKYSLLGVLLEEYLEFSLEGVMLPDNYAERRVITNAPIAISYGNFNVFPDNIKEAIKKRYKEQSKNEEKVEHGPS